MIHAYILGKLEIGSENEALNSIKNIKEMKKASLTYGIYDLCIEGQFKTMEDLDSFLMNQLRKISGIKDTVTLIASRTVFSQPGEAIAFG